MGRLGEGRCGKSEGRGVRVGERGVLYQGVGWGGGSAMHSSLSIP